MPVYNVESYLRTAIESILAQTFTDFELIIVDDGSTDCTAQIAGSYRDGRIRLVRNATNLGNAAARNHGIGLARGRFIAGQDGDDRSLPCRIERQVAFLEGNAAAGLVGCSNWVIDAEGRRLRLVRLPETNFLIQRDSLLYYPFCHGATVFRASCVQAVGAYDSQFTLASDYDFMLRVAERFELGNVGEPLYEYRRHSMSVTAARRDLQLSFMKRGAEAAIQRRSQGRHQLGHLHELALARHCLRQAIGFCVAGDAIRAQAALREADARDSSVLDNGDLICWCIEELAPTYSGAALDPLVAARGFLQQARQVGGLRRNTARQVTAKCHVLAAFSSYSAGDLTKTRGHVAQALRYDPQWVRNRGVISMGLESLIGRVAMRRARAIIGR